MLFGFFLDPAAFGTYAFVIGIITIANVLKDGNLPDHLVRLGSAVDRQTIQNALAGALATNTVAGLLLIAVSQLALFDAMDGEVNLLLMLAAAAMPLGSHFGVAVGVLQSRYSFKKAAFLFFVQPSVQVISALVLAAFLRSAMALVLGLLVSAVVGSIVGVCVSKIPMVPVRGAWRDGIRMVWNSRWLMVGSLGIAAIWTGDYLGLGLSWPKALLGAYYFGYQIPAQVGGIASSVGQVILAALPRVSSIEARRSLLISGTLTLGYIVAPICVTIAIVLPTAEQLIWGGRWHEAVVVGQIFALLFPLRLLLSVARSTRLATGQYRRWSTHVLAAGAGLLAVSAAVGTISDSLTVVSSVVGIYLACVVAGLAGAAFRSQGIGLRSAAKAILEPYFVCLGISIPIHTWVALGVESLVLVLLAVVAYWVTSCAAIRQFRPAVWRRIVECLPLPGGRRRIADHGVSPEGGGVHQT